MNKDADNKEYCCPCCEGLGVFPNHNNDKCSLCDGVGKLSKGKYDGIMDWEEEKKKAKLEEFHRFREKVAQEIYQIEDKDKLQEILDFIREVK
jgi:hypothetical protein